MACFTRDRVLRAGGFKGRNTGRVASRIRRCRAAVRRAIACRCRRFEAGDTLRARVGGWATCDGRAGCGSLRCTFGCTLGRGVSVGGCVGDKAGVVLGLSLGSVSWMSCWRSFACVAAGEDEKPARAALQLANARMSLSCGVIAGLVIDLW